MKNLLAIIFALFITSCISNKEENSLGLCFYSVSKEKINNGKFINTVQFPNLGYIKNSPDLRITQLKYVDCRPTHLISYFKGKKEKERIIPVVTLSLLEEDCNKLKEFAIDNKERKILIAFDGIFIASPFISKEINLETVKFRLSDGLNYKEMNDKLQRLVRIGDIRRKILNDK